MVPPRPKMRIYRRPIFYGSGRSDVFRKAPPVNSIGRSCLEIAGLDGIRSDAPMFLSDRLVSEGALRSSASCYHHATCFLVHGEVI
jgi:hypothetical protein